MDQVAAAVKQLEESQPERQTQAKLGQQLTISELDAVRQQIEQCWVVPAGAREAENLVVQLRVEMNPDGTVRTAELQDRARMASDSFYRAAAERSEAHTSELQSLMLFSHAVFCLKTKN